MRKLPKPNVDVQESYDLCVEGVRSDATGLAAAAVRGRVLDLARQYDALAAAGQLFQLRRCVDEFDASITEALKGLYVGQLRRQNSRARSIYSQLVASVPLLRCPICGVGIVRTLDHYLSRSSHGQFAVHPFNLVPACRDCNTNKLDATFSSEGEQPLHAYYDDFGSHLWLRARVLHGIPPGVYFYVDASPEWGATAQARLESHLKCFGLVDTFISNAGDEIAMLESRLSALGRDGGTASVVQYLQGEANLSFKERGNAWQSALYKALAEDSWYCSRFDLQSPEAGPGETSTG